MINNNIIILFIAAIFGLVGTYLITPIVGNYMRSIGKVGRDVHKINTPEIPESGGIGFMLIYLIIIIGGILVSPYTLVTYRLVLILFILILVTILGLYDDFKQLSAILKPALLVIIALPVFLFREYDGVKLLNTRPVLPFVGSTRLDIFYWGLAIFVIAVPSNASNMLDVMNGVMSGSGFLIGITAFIASYIIPLSPEAAFLTRFTSLSLAATQLGFWIHNRYPAKIFAGDTGSLGVGAIIGLIAIYGEIEFVLIIALLVHIMNSFSFLSSVRGLKERHDIKTRPVYVKDGVVYASRDIKAPITLVRLIVARSPLPENKIVNEILKLVFYSCILALVTAYLIRKSI